MTNALANGSEGSRDEGDETDILGNVLRIPIYIPGIPSNNRTTFPARESRGFGFCFSFACCRSNILRTVRTKRVSRDIK